MPLPLWLKIAMAAIGLVMFGIQAAMGMSGVRRADSHDERLEAGGAIVPALGGLLFAGGALSSSTGASLALVASGLGISVFGRALYEFVVFRGDRAG
jgi:hypothetical protein